MVYVHPTVVAQGPARDAAGQLRPVEGLECRFVASPDGRHDPQVVADAQMMAAALAASSMVWCRTSTRRWAVWRRQC